MVKKISFLFFPELGAPTEGKRCSGHFIKGAFPSGTNFIFKSHFNLLNVLKFERVVHYETKG
jgi:hypothetical protein